MICPGFVFGKFAVYMPEAWVECILITDDDCGFHLPSFQGFSSNHSGRTQGPFGEVCSFGGFAGVCSFSFQGNIQKPSFQFRTVLLIFLDCIQQNGNESCEDPQSPILSRILHFSQLFTLRCPPRVS